MYSSVLAELDTAWMQTPFVDLGLVPGAASSLLGPRLMGYQRAFAMLAMGDRFTAEMARDAGLVNAVIESDELEAHAMAEADRLANKPPEALAIARRLLRGDNTEVVARIKEEAALFSERLKSDEARNAFMAFMQKKAK